MQEAYLSEFGEILLFIIGSLLFMVVTILVASLIRPSRPNPQKLTTYESGEEPVSNAWTQFNVRFYVVALIFLLFEVEIVFLFPWATIFAKKELIQQTNGAWGWFSLLEMLLFIGILALGLACYGALFALVGVLLKRPLVVGLVFAFGWEQIALLIPGYLNRLTLAHYLQALVPHAMPASETTSLLQAVFREVPSAPASLFWLFFALAATLYLAARTVERREFVLEQ